MLVAHLDSVYNDEQGWQELASVYAEMGLFVHLPLSLLIGVDETITDTNNPSRQYLTSSSSRRRTPSISSCMQRLLIHADSTNWRTRKCCEWSS